jgi:hypothetical protein
MAVRFRKIHPALKHAAYSATTLLPGEDRAAFDKLHRDLIAEFNPLGVLEKDYITNLAHLVWRSQNLAPFRVAELAKARRQKIVSPMPKIFMLGQDEIDPVKQQEAYRIADEQARQELGDIHQLIDVGEPATIDGLMKELDVIERLDGMITRCLKQLLIIRGVKSLSSTPSSESAP